MKILKYKKRPNGKYSLFLDDDREFVYYEEVILQYELLLKKEIDEKTLLKIHNTNLEYDVYYVALNSIKSRFKSVYELREFLRKKEYPDEMIDKAIEKLLQQGYLNDRMFAKSYINSQILTTTHGPNRIKGDLMNKKIDPSIIEEEIVVYNSEIQEEKIRKLIERGMKSNHTRGGFVLKQKIVNDLKLQGFDYDIISKVISQYCFENDLNLAKKEYEKLYKKYSRKYDGCELKNKIREKMYQKGFSYEED